VKSVMSVKRAIVLRLVALALVVGVLGSTGAVVQAAHAAGDGIGPWPNSLSAETGDVNGRPC
jgi:hypothetical protein